MVKRKYFYLFVVAILILNIIFIGLFNLWNTKKYDVKYQNASDLSKSIMSYIYAPAEGFVPDEKTAIQFAQAAASVKFPGQRIPFYDTYSVYWDEENNFWIVYIYDLFGRATYVVVDRTTGKIINMLSVSR